MTRARDLADSADKDIAGTLTLDAVNASGVITGLTVEATGDTAAGDNAALGYTAAEGLVLTGQGSTNDVTIKNDADADVIEIPTGTVNVTMAGTLGVVGEIAAASLDISGAIDVDGTTNLDVVDIDGAVNMATTALVTGVLTTTAATVFNGGFASNDGSTISTADNTDTLSLISTDADVNAGPNLRMYRNKGTPANADILGVIDFEGRNNNSEDVIYAEILTQINDVTDGSEDGSYYINTMVAGAISNRMNLIPAETIFNEEGKNIDFRVESNGNTACLFVDGGEDRVGINEDVPLEELHISGNGNGKATIALQRLQAGLSTQSRGSIVSFNSATKAMCGISFNAGGDNDNGDIQFYATNDNTSSASLFDLDRLVVFGATGTVFNEDSGNKDFRIESDGHTHGLFLDASNGIVCIGTNDLSVAGNTGSSSGINLDGGGVIEAAAYQKTVAYFNRMNNDGVVVEIRQNGAIEGTISVSGNTVSYNGFSGRHESSGIPANTPVGTVVSTIDTLDVYPDNATDTKGNAISHPKAGQIRADHAQVEVSTSEGDACVYGVVSEFDTDGKLIVTSVGIGSVRVTGACAKGDLLESNGDGTAKVQSDDIVRSKTLGKVTIGNSNTGVKLVACVMYCG